MSTAGPPQKRKTKENESLQEQWSKGNTRRRKVITDLPVAMGPSSGAIAHRNPHECISPHRPSSARGDLSRYVGSAPIVTSLVLRLTALPSAALER